MAFFGKDCLAAGLVTAMLGARVAFLCSRNQRADFVRNARLYQKDTLDYTKTKSSVVTVHAFGAKGFLNVDAATVCELLSAPPPLDMIIVMESALEEQAESSPGRKHAQPQDSDPAPPLTSFLASFIPNRAPTRVLLICDGRSALQVDRRSPHDNINELLEPLLSVGSGLPQGFELPADWVGRSFSCLGQRFPVVLLERQDADLWRNNQPRTSFPLRRYLPPMGASSAVCGCGGHPQKVSFNHRVINPKWHENNARLKDALMSHNRSQQCKTADMLEEARAWAKVARSASSAPPTARGGYRRMVDRTDLGPTTETDDDIAGLESRLVSPGRPDSEESSQQMVWTEAFGAEGQHSVPTHGGSPASVGEECPRAQTAPGVCPSSWQELRHNTMGRSEAAAQSTSSQTACSTPADVAMDMNMYVRAADTVRPPSTQVKSTHRSGQRPRQRGNGRSSTLRGASVPGITGPTIAERHARPPHWYRCNRPFYGPDD